jgi:hypothetical protein
MASRIKETHKTKANGAHAVSFPNGEMMSIDWIIAMNRK